MLWPSLPTLRKSLEVDGIDAGFQAAERYEFSAEAAEAAGRQIVYQWSFSKMNKSCCLKFK